MTAFTMAIATLLVSVASPSNAVKVGDSTYEVNDQGYKVNGKAVDMADAMAVDDNTNTRNAKFGASIGAKLAVAEKLASVESIKSKATQVAAANVALEKQLTEYAAWEAGAKATKLKLTTAIDSAGVAPPLVSAALPCVGSTDGVCGTHGSQEFLLLLKGETYAGVAGLVECTTKVSAGDPRVIKSEGVAKVTGVSGKASLVRCKSPKFNPSQVTQKTFEAEVTATVGGKAMAGVGGKTIKLKFAATPPSVDLSNPCALATCLKLNEDGKLEFTSGSLDAKNTASFDFIVNDPDSKYADIKASTSYKGPLFKSTSIQKVKDNGDGTFHMRLLMTQVDKFKVATDTSTLVIELADNLNSAKISIPLHYVAVNGESVGAAGDSCAHLKEVGVTKSGQYFVKYGGPAVSMWCDQEMDGGGWALVATQTGNGQFRQAGSIKPVVKGPNKNENQRYSQTIIKRFSDIDQYQVVAEENRGQDKVAGLVMMFKMAKGIVFPFQTGYVERNSKLPWHIGNGKYKDARSNARGCWYGVSCHGGEMNGIERSKRCTKRKDFAQTGGRNGDYKMDHCGTHTGTTRCMSGQTGIGVGHFFRPCADAAKVGAKAKC